MSPITRVLIVIFLLYVMQSTLAWFQIKRSYRVIQDVKTQHLGEDCLMVTGTGKTKWLFITRGYFIILLVDHNDRIKDYYGMDGYTVFASPKQKKEYIGKSLDELDSIFSKKNEKLALKSAREQLALLREQNVAVQCG